MLRLLVVELHQEKGEAWSVPAHTPLTAAANIAEHTTATYQLDQWRDDCILHGGPLEFVGDHHARKCDALPADKRPL